MSAEQKPGIQLGMVSEEKIATIVREWLLKGPKSTGMVLDEDVHSLARAITFDLKGLIGDRQHHGLDNDRQVFFYEQEFYVLSNFSSFNLFWKNFRFDTSEAAYHWEKFADLNDREGLDIRQRTELRLVLMDIEGAGSAHAAFKIAEKHKHLRRPDWDDVKIGIMKQILRAKAEQHEYVRRKLLETGDRELIENSWRDDFWGWGPNREGKNMLGRLWMEVRAELRAAGGQ